MKKSKKSREGRTTLRAILALSLVFVIGFSQSAHEAGVTYSNPKTMDEAIRAYLSMFPNLTYTEAQTNFLVESSGNPKCKYYEPTLNEHSWGPGQILESTARALGYDGPMEKMLTWKVGAFWSMKYLSDCKARAVEYSNKKYQKYDRYVVRRHMYHLYNAGMPKWKWKVVNGKRRWVYKNRWHVLKCERVYWKKYNLNKQKGSWYVHDPCS